MKRLFTSLFFICLFASSFSAQTTKPTATPTPAADIDEDVVKISTTLIQVDVTVTDKSGKIITDLKPEDFEIFENNQKQDITNFSFVSAAPDASPTPNSDRKNNSKDTMMLPPATMLKPEQVRRTLALVVDDLSVSFENIHFVRRALRKFVDTQMQEGDLVAIIRTGGGIGALQQFTSDRRQLYAAIERIRWNPLGRGGITAFEPIGTKPPASALEEGLDENSSKGLRDPDQEASNFRQSVYATGTLGAVNYIVKGMRELPGRKSVMLFSEGFKLFNQDAFGKETDFRVKAALENLVDLANRAAVVIYTMDVRGLQTLGLTAADSTSSYTAQEVQQQISNRRDELFDSQEGLNYLARQTGGLSVINNNDYNQGIQRMLNDQKGYYLIGYAPDADTFDAKTRRFNRLIVKLKRPDLRVRYRSGFFGVTDEDISLPAKLTPAQQITAALTSPFGANGISLRLNALFGNDVKTGPFVRSLLHIDAKDLKFTDEADGSHKATFDVLAISFGENGIVADRISKNYTLTLPDAAFKDFLREGFVYNFVFPVKKAGAYQLRVALRDSASEKVGSANQFIEVPNLKKGALTLSGMILENLTVQQFRDFQAGKPASSNEPRTSSQINTSLRRFQRGTILRYGFEIYNAKADTAQRPQLTSQTRIFREGKLLFEGKPTPIDLTGQNNWQRVAASGALSMGTEMLPGDYVMQLIVTDNLAKEKRKTATQFVQFEIIE